jgi:L-asparaginase
LYEIEVVQIRSQLLACALGFVTPGDYPNTIASGSLNPVKSRRQLQVREDCPHHTRHVLTRHALQVLLALNKTNDEIRTAFEEPLKTYLNLNISSYY